MNGWIGRILRVDLTTGTIYREELNRTYAAQAVGQRGLALRYCLEAPGRFVLMTGPLTGLFGACTNQFSAAFYSPRNGHVTAVSAGGHFGPELKLAGYDGIILEGACGKPSWLTIHDGQAELRGAEEVWGKGVQDSTAYLLAHSPRQARALCIGPAGERRSPLAAVVSEHHFNLGGGSGAALGGMGLKGIAVRGSGVIGIAKTEEYLTGAMRDRQALMDDPVTPALGNDKACQIEALMRNMSDDPETAFAGRRPVQKETEAGACRVLRRSACYSCPIGCHTFLETPDGAQGMSPGYTQGWTFGRDCGLDTLSDVLKAVWLCREYGLDPAACGGAVGRAIAAGLGPEELSLSKPPRRGDLDTVLALIRQAGTGEGAGARLLDDECAKSAGTPPERTQEILESVGVCPFAGAVMTPAVVADRLSAATGEEFSEARLESVCASNLDLER